MIQAPSPRRYVGIDSIPHRAALFAHAGPLNAAAHYTELLVRTKQIYVQPVSHLLTSSQSHRVCLARTLTAATKTAAAGVSSLPLVYYYLVGRRLSVTTRNYFIFKVGRVLTEWDCMGLMGSWVRLATIIISRTGME